MKQKISFKEAFYSRLFLFFSHLSKSTFSSLLKQQGYTLVEILIAIAIFGILAGIAVPQTTIWVDHYRLNGAARLVWGDLQNAKMTAIKTNQTVTVTFDSTTSYSFSQAGNTIFTRNLTREYPNITVVRTGGGNLTFGSTGMTQNSTITVQGPDGTKSVTTLWTGRITST